MIYAERANRSALIINSEGRAERLKRVPFMDGSFNEAWLQELIEDNPILVPSYDVNDSFFPLVCIGREVPVGCGENHGYIDNLYMTPTGKVVLVETKLFRNQEARRTVVAQIIDYAKDIQKWDCKKLDDVAADYTLHKYGQSYRMIDLMAQKGYLTPTDEAEFTDKVNNNLKSSSFLLMILGDGIRSGVQQLADFLNENSLMSFSLALAELEIYQSGESAVVIPYLLTKTSVIERTVYVNQSSEYSVAESIPEVKEQIQQSRKPILTQKEFIDVFAKNGDFDSLSLADVIGDLSKIDRLSVGIAPTELTIRFNIEDSSYALITFGISQNQADVWITPKRIKAALEKHGIFPFEADEFLESFKGYIDVRKCKTAPYENESGFYYANVNEIISNSKQLIASVEKFSLSALRKS